MTWKNEVTFVDGFSGPWESKTADFSDTSFMIAIDVLQDVQKYFREQGKEKIFKCFFVENDPEKYAQLEPSVKAHHDPINGFHVETFCGDFEDGVLEIGEFLGTSFALVFIDPKGWTGFAFDKIESVLRHEPGEVLINIMYDHMNRFINSDDPEIEASFAPILGGPKWKDHLDPTLPRGQAVLNLFRNELKMAGRFEFVTTTRIDKTTADRPHYFLAYGTRNAKGLKAFRDVEWNALRAHEGSRKAAKLGSKENKSGQWSLFSAEDLPDDGTIEAIVEENKKLAKTKLVDDLRQGGASIPFSEVWPKLMENFMLRETNVKDVCVELANEGVIEATWKTAGKRKPHDHHFIVLKPA